MKTPMKRTVFKVILRKSEYKEQWSLIIESFPVFVPGREKPMRKHEPLGRFVTTPIWDKNSSGRTLADGKAYYRPKRDVNGSSNVDPPLTKRRVFLQIRFETYVSMNTITNRYTRKQKQNKRLRTKDQNVTLSSTLKT